MHEAVGHVIGYVQQARSDSSDAPVDVAGSVAVRVAEIRSAGGVAGRVARKSLRLGRCAQR